MWCEFLFLWSAASYGVTADPLKGEVAKFRWKPWIWLLILRAVLAGVLSYAMARSITFSSFLLVICFAQPLLRYRLPVRWLAEFECLSMSAVLDAGLMLIRHFHLASRWAPVALTLAQTAALCIVGSTLVLVVRGGTFVVRGVLKKAGTLPSRTQGVSAAAVTAGSSQADVDVEELNRGRLIGNLERIVLTMVVAAGSYAALAFLVAAKGLVRSEEFEKSRDFTEYFLIGSLSSVLVALCAGLALRYALLALWPDLLVLQMQQ